MRPHGSPKQLEHRRRKAIALLEQGLQPVDVAEQLGVDRRSVRRWKAAYRKNGIKGILSKQAKGRPSKLNSKEKKNLEKLLTKGPRAVGFQTDLWTCPRIAELIYSNFGIRYHVDHVCRILHSLGWSPQKPQRRAKERNEKEIKKWVREDWPRIKKKPRA